MMLGLEINQPIDGVVARLKEKGVRIKGSIARDEPGNFVHLEDPDGNEIYLWEVAPRTVPATDFDNELVPAGARR
jgi:hypothetical protein